MVLVKRGLLLLCLVLSFFSIASVHAPFNIFIVSPYQKATKPFQSANGSAILESGSTVSGWVRASGGQANDIRFYVTDSNNVTVAAYGDVTYTEFSFVASTTGNYTAHFDNSFSIDPKSVSFNYSITPPILGIPQTLFYTILAIMSIAAVVVIAIVFILVRRRKRSRRKKTK
jgi:hypothetical protein